MITIFLFCLVSYALGFIAGYFSNHPGAINTAVTISGHTISNTIKSVLPDNTVRPGIIRRPTAKDLENRNLPQKVKDERAAMKETLDQIPELQEHKRLLKQLETIQP